MHSSRRRQIHRLQAIKVLRSLGQGALLVNFALYLDALGWQAGQIGVLFSAGGFVTAALSIPIGVASDRVGRKAFVFANEAVIVAAAVAAMLSSDPIIVAAASLLGAFGRGQVGMIGPAGPAEQAWMAELTTPAERGRIYSANSALGFVGTGIGALAAGLMPLWSDLFPGTLAYRPFFALVVVTGVVNMVLIAKTRTLDELRREAGAGIQIGAGGEAGQLGEKGFRGGEEGVRTGEDGARAGEEGAQASDDGVGAGNVGAHTGPAFVAELSLEEEARIRRQENIILLKLCGINAINGLAIGLTSPLLAYWFFLKFGTGPGALGPVFAITFFATGAASIITGVVAERIGLVRSIVAVRLLAVVLLILMPIVPYFWVAALIHVVRSALNRGTQGTRQALTVSLVRDERRGFASSMNGISNRVPNALGPLLAGFMLDAGYLALPFLVGAVMQFVYGILFGRAFQAYDPTARPDRSAPNKPMQGKASDEVSAASETRKTAKAAMR